MNVFNEIVELKKELDLLGPLDSTQEQTLWDKLRLEWNYNSNHIEGNTLTLGETELLLRLGDEFRAKNNSLKDVNEMRAHDAAIFMLREWSENTERKLLETDIVHLNQTILVKDYWSDAITPDGNKTRKKIRVGQYKEQPNHVLLKSGEYFKYAEPYEVKPKMQELLHWYNQQEGVDPIITATLLHYKFVLIHPFDDGNGRVSRLLMNYHLMKQGYPPVIIKSEDKENYLYALRQADAGNEEAFIIYIAEQLKWSLDLNIRVRKGEDITEKGDLDKQIELLKRKAKSKIPQGPKRTKILVNKLYQRSFSKLLSRIENKSKTFDELFLRKRYKRSVVIDKMNEDVIDFSNCFNKFYPEQDEDFKKIELSVFFGSPLNKNGDKRFYSWTTIEIKFDLFQYIILIDEQIKIYKQYDQILTSSEFDSLIVDFMSLLYDGVKKIVN